MVEPTARAELTSPGSAVLYSIAEVASLTELSPATVRAWERDGLIRPRRTAGGHRLYSDVDVDRLRRIRYLRHVARLNAAGVRRELGPAENPPVEANGGVTATDPNLGPRLRAARTEKGLALADAARTTGLSVSFLSAVELGQSGISLVNLFKLAELYGVTIASLQDGHQNAPRRVLRPGGRPRYVVDDGRVTVEDLIDQAGKLRATMMEIAPGGESGDAYTHPGEEFVYVLAGQVAFWVDEDEYHELRAGESIHLFSTLLHRWRNIGETSASLLWVNMIPPPHARRTAGRSRQPRGNGDGPRRDPPR